MVTTLSALGIVQSVYIRSRRFPRSQYSSRTARRSIPVSRAGPSALRLA
jgi:hypothetical protein